MKNYYCTKYALTLGIDVRQGEPEHRHGSNRIRVCSGRGPKWMVLGRDLFETAYEAEAAAETMQAQRIAVLKRELAELHDLKILAPG